MNTVTKQGRRQGHSPYQGDANALRKFTDRPIAQRPELAIGRNGAKVKPRRHHLVSERIEELKVLHNAGDTFPNPHNNRGMYWYIVETFKSLGIDQMHSYSRFMQKLRSLMSGKDTKDIDRVSDWDHFVSKDARNPETGRDHEGRIWINILVLQRTNSLTSANPYGLKLLEVGTKVLGTKGAVIDILVRPADGKKFLRLNTNSANPLKQSGVRGVDGESVNFDDEMLKSDIKALVFSGTTQTAIEAN